jgi:hypothetical protein
MSMRSIVAALAVLALGVPAAGAKQTTNAKCNKAQQEIAAQIGGDVQEHVRKHFTPKGSYLVTDYVYQNFVKGKAKLGRPGPNGNTYLFVASGKFIVGVLAAAKKADGTTDFAVIEQKLGLPTGTYKPDGGLWRVDVNVPISCYRFPKADDPGANSDFKAGGFTSGGVPEILVLDGRPSYAAQIVKKGVQKPAGTGPAKGGKARGKAGN